MSNILEYKGYHAKIEFDTDDMLLVGEVFGIQDSLNFHGNSPAEIEEMFHQSIDNYLELCAEIGKSPDKEYKGSFNVRIKPHLHREAAFAADRKGITLNQFVEDAVQEALNPAKAGPIYVFNSELFSLTSGVTDSPRNVSYKTNYQTTHRSYVS